MRARDWPSCPGCASASSAPSPASQLQLDPGRRRSARLLDAAAGAGARDAHAPGLASVASSASLLRPEMHDHAATRRAPPTSASRPPSSPRRRASPPSATSTPALAKLTCRDRQIPIRVGFAAATLRRPGADRAAARARHGGGTVPLAAVADISSAAARAQIDR